MRIKSRRIVAPMCITVFVLSCGLMKSWADTVKPNDTVEFIAGRSKVGDKVTVDSPTFTPPANHKFAEVGNATYASVSPPALDGASVRKSPDSESSVAAQVTYTDATNAVTYSMSLNGKLVRQGGGGGGGGVPSDITWAAQEKAVSIVFDSVSSADYIGKNSSDEEVYATAQGTGAVVIKLKVDPAGATVPGGTVTWTGGQDGGDQLTRKVSKASLVEAGEVVKAEAGGRVIALIRVYVFPGKPTAAAVIFTMTRTRDNSVVTEGLAGLVDLWPTAIDPTNVYKTYYDNKKWNFVFESSSYEVKWGTDSGGRADVSDPAANPFPLGKGMPAASTEAQKKTKAKADLTPDATGRVPRTAYWSEALTVKHEIFHMDDWEGNHARPALGKAETWIEAQTESVTVTTLSPAGVIAAKKLAFDAKVTAEALDAYTDYSEEAEKRAYADGKAAYQDLANAITP